MKSVFRRPVSLQRGSPSWTHLPTRVSLSPLAFFFVVACHLCRSGRRRHAGAADGARIDGRAAVLGGDELGVALGVSNDAGGGGGPGW